MVGLMASAACVAEDGLINHQWEERSLCVCVKEKEREREIKFLLETLLVKIFLIVFPSSKPQALHTSLNMSGS